MPDFLTNLSADLLQLGLGNALAAALLALLVAAVTFPLRRRRPALVHALWLVVLLKLMTPPLWTLPLTWPTPQPAATAPPAPPAEASADVVLVEVELLDIAPEAAAPA